MRVLLALMSFVFCFSAWAGVTSVPDMFYDTPFVNLDDVVLGSTCYSLAAGPEGLDCNPAFMYRHQKRLLRANLVLDRRVSSLFDYGQKVSDGDSSGLIQKILSQDQASAARLGTSIWYQHDWWAVGFVPLRLHYASNVLNPAYPHVALSLIRESEVFAQAGVGLDEIPELSLGLGIHYLSQKYIDEEADLLNVPYDPSVVNIQSRNVLRLDPALAYNFSGDDWKPVLSVTVTHLEVYSSAGTPLPPGVEMGFSSTPKFAGGRLTTSTHFSLGQPGVHLFKRVRFGARYDWPELFSVAASFSKGDYGLAASTAIDSLTLGLAYKNEELDYARWDSPSSDTVMAEAGLRF